MIFCDKNKNSSKFLFKKFTTRDGIVGDYPYAHLFKPKMPFRDTIYKYILHKPIPWILLVKNLFPIESRHTSFVGVSIWFPTGTSHVGWTFSASINCVSSQFRNKTCRVLGFCILNLFCYLFIHTSIQIPFVW